VQADKKLIPYELLEKNGKIAIKLPAMAPQTFGPEEISAMVLTKMKQIAED